MMDESRKTLHKANMFLSIKYMCIYLSKRTPVNIMKYIIVVHYTSSFLRGVNKIIHFSFLTNNMKTKSPRPSIYSKITNK